MTEELKKRFAEIGDQSMEENPLVIAKLFDPMGSATWYATQYDPETDVCFGYVSGQVYDPEGRFDQWGTFSIGELESIQRGYPKLIFGNEVFVPQATIGIERDTCFEEMRFNELMEKQHSLGKKKKAPDIEKRIKSLEGDGQDVSKGLGSEIEF